MPKPETQESDKSLLYKDVSESISISMYIIPDCQDLLRRMLEPDPEQRLGVSQLIDHNWINEGLTKLLSSPLKTKLTQEV